MNSNAKVIKTNDGSDTIYLPNMDEHYHSTNGARQESEHVYIKNGIQQYVLENPVIEEINILEVGFGTGLNAFLTYNFSNSYNIKINYITIEPFPIDIYLVKSLDFNFTSSEKDMFIRMHELEWEEGEKLSENFKICKIKTSLEALELEPDSIDIVYFDAFAPNKQKNIWNPGNFLKMKNVLKEQVGILVTYCAQGEFKRTVKKLGFTIKELKGPPGKRVMTRLNK